MGLHFRRRPVAPADLPPVGPSTRPPLSARRVQSSTAPAVEALREASTVAARAAETFRDMGPVAARLSRAASAASTATSTIGPLREVRPDVLAETEVYLLRAVVRPSGVFTPGTYQVVYHRIGRYGRRGTPAPIPLTTYADTLADLRTAIADDAEQHLDGVQPDVLVDMQVMGGTIRTHDAPAGTFTLHVVDYSTKPIRSRETTRDH